MPAFTPYMSEIRFLGGASTDFVEIALDEGYDPALISVVVYHNNGTIRSTNSLDSTPDNTIAGSDIYTVENGIHKMGAVALVVNGTVVSFVSFHDSVTATEGPANGMTTDQLGTNTRGDSFVSTDMGDTYTVNTTPDPGTIPCFLKGTRIETANGGRRIEDLRVGDQIITQDDGAQTLLWIGSRHLVAQKGGEHGLAPVRIPAGALGAGIPTRDICVSPAHRILIQAAMFELLFEASEVLIAAQHLVGLNGIHIAHDVVAPDYYHMLFDTHQLVRTSGMISESFHPMQQGLTSLEASARTELFTLFPELKYRPASYGPTSRRCLRGFEAPFVRESLRMAA